MNDATQVCLGLLGAVIGFPVGALVAYYLIGLLGRAVFGRDFFQFRWAILMFGVPLSGFLGTILGVQIAATRPHIFAVTFIPLAVFFLILVVAQYHMRRVIRPRVFTVKVTTEFVSLMQRAEANNRNFVGRVEADGVSHEIKGTIPATLTFNAVRIDYQITLTDGEEGEWFAVVISADNQYVQSIFSDLKVTGSAETRGIGWCQRAGGPHGVELRNFKKSGA